MYQIRTLSAGLILVSSLVIFSACNRMDERRPSTVKAAERRRQAPNFSLKDSDGRTVSLADYKGKVVLLNFWATWCGPCKIEIPWFIEFEQKYKDRGFAVLGVSMDDDGWDVVKPYLSEKKINYRVAVGNDSVGQLYGGIDSLPTTFVIDREGRVAASHVGLIGKSDYQNEILQLLDTKSGSSAPVHSASGSN